MKYLLGIDNGGTFAKAAIFDLNGKQVASAGQATVTLTPKPGYTERDMQALWLVNASVIKEAIHRSGISAGQIVGVSFSGHGKGLYAVDAEGKPAYSGILSTDTRAWAYVEKWERDGTTDRVFANTYQTILANQPVSLLAWLKDNEPEVFQKIAYVFSVKDYIRFRMTGIANGEYTDFSGGNLINLKTKKYDFEVLDLLGIPEVFDKLPPLKQASDICGSVTEEASRLTGLATGTPVAAGMFDINACGIASGLGDSEKLSMIAGTWSINEYIGKTAITDGSVALNSLYCIPDYFLIEESSPTSAGNLEWYINTFLPELKAEAKSNGSSAYRYVDSWVEEVGPEESQLVFLPYLNGSAEDALAKGTLVGMSMYHGRKHVTRAIFEGIVFSHYAHLEKLLVNRDKPRRIQLSGGVTNSGVWVQMFADVMQVPIEVVEGKEQGCQGAAMAAGIAVGLYEDYQDAIATCVKISKTVFPRSEKALVYREKYQRYLAVAAALKPVWSCFED